MHGNLMWVITIFSAIVGVYLMSFSVHAPVGTEAEMWRHYLEVLSGIGLTVPLFWQLSCRLLQKHFRDLNKSD